MKKLKPKKFKYKAEIIKKRNPRLWDKFEKVLDALDEAIAFSDKRTKEDVEELVKNSPVFAGLNQLCTQIVPLYSDFKPAKINYDLEEQRLLYSYYSEAQWNQVKDFYIEWFAKQEWQFINESSDTRFPDKIIATKADYKITIYSAHVINCCVLIGKKL